MSNNLAVFNKAGDLQKFLESGKSAVAMALPKHLNPDRMLRLALTSFQTTAKLRECTGVSILSSLVVASQIGLEPGVAGQGYLIPYGNTCTFVPGWQGLVSLLNNSGRATAWTGSVFDGDLWDFQLGSAPRCVHVPGPNYGDPEKLIWVYACGKVNGSEQPVVEAWPIARVWKHRDRFNKVGSRHYSFQHPEMYARKVVLLQVLKYMPRSVELQDAIVAANAHERGATSRVEDGVVVEVETEVSTPSQPRVAEPPKGTRTLPEAPVDPETAADPEPSEEPKAATNRIYKFKTPAEKATPLQGVVNLCKASGVKEDDLLTYLKANGACSDAATDIGELTDTELQHVISNWESVLAGMEPSAPVPDGRASVEPTAKSILGACVRLDLDQKDVVKWAKANKWCDAKAQWLSELNPSALTKIAANIEASVNEISPQ